MKTRPPAPGHPPDRHGTLAVLVGLAVIWFALFIVFRANQLSMPHMRVSRPMASMDPRLRFMQPASVRVQNLARRQAIKDLARQIDLRVADAELAAVDNDELMNRSLSGENFLTIFHALIGNGHLGLLVSGRHLRLVGQEVTVPAAGATEWRADAVEMDSPEIGIAPLPEPPLWFTLRLGGSADQPLARRRTVGLEAWRGATPIGETTATLDAAGAAEFDLAGSDRVQMKLQQAKPPQGETNPVFRIDMIYHGARPQAGAKGK